MTYRLPTLNGLRAFEAAARHLSFKNAAGELGVTAGAVSQQVRKLEMSLGISLFRRLPNGLLLTREGEIYSPEITRLFDQLTAATDAIAPDMNARKFAVGLAPAAAGLLPKRWPHHSDDLRRSIRTVVSTDDPELILDNRIDCLIRAHTGAVGPFAGPLARVTILVATGPAADHAVHVVCRQGMIDCWQSRAIIADLQNCLRPASAP